MTAPRGPHEPDGTTWGGPPAGGWGPEPMYPGPERGEYGRGAPGPYDDEPEYGWQPPGYQPAGGYGSAPPAGAAAYRAEPGHEASCGRGYPPTSRRAARRRRRPPWIPLAVAGAVVVVLLVLGFVTPGWFVTRVFDASAVQTGVAKILTDDYGAEGVADVHCPDGVEVGTGTTFTCDATIDGDPVKVPVRVTDGDGGYEVGRPA